MVRTKISALFAMVAFSAVAGSAIAAPPQEVVPQTATISAPAEEAGPEQPKPATVRVALQTTAGPIVLELEEERAPITTANFLRYVDARRFDGQNFYRALNMAKDFGLIQAGVRELKPGDKPLPPAIAHEPTTLTGLSHKTGAISMARREEGTAQSDFFIVVGDMSSLDAHPEKPGDNSGFAVFGHVVEGMDVVRAIMTAKIDPAKGAEDGMAGQILAEPVKILTARRVEVPAPQ